MFTLGTRDTRPAGSHAHPTRPAYTTTTGDLYDASKYDALSRAIATLCDVTTWHEVTPAERKAVDRAVALIARVMPQINDEPAPY